MSKLTIKLDNPRYLPTKAHESDAGYDLKAKILNSCDKSDCVLAQLLKYPDKTENPQVYLPKVHLNGELIFELEGDLRDKSKIIALLNTAYVLLAPITNYIFDRDLAYLLTTHSNQAIISTGVYVSSLKDFSDHSLVWSDEKEDWVHSEDYVNPASIPALLVLPRSGLAAKHQIAIANSPGLIDRDYTGEIKIILENRSKDIHIFTDGTRLAQLVPIKVWGGSIEITEEVKATNRSSSGLGSTGVK